VERYSSVRNENSYCDCEFIKSTPQSLVTPTSPSSQKTARFSWRSPRTLGKYMSYSITNQINFCFKKDIIVCLGEQYYMLIQVYLSHTVKRLEMLSVRSEIVPLSLMLVSVHDRVGPGATTLRVDRSFSLKELNITRSTPSLLVHFANPNRWARRRAHS
jgi:hypothetical protein